MSGALAALALPPAGFSAVVWVALVPLLWSLHRCRSLRAAFACGYLSGVVFFLLTIYPMVSAHSWSGWAAEAPAMFARRMSRQWWFMHAVWVLFALGCALWWGAWAAAVHQLAGGRPWRWLIAASAGWVLLAEWARAQLTFGSTWMFLGYATADLGAIRQLAALGGVWFLSALVAAVNAGVAWGVFHRRDPSWWRMPAVVLFVVGAGTGYGLRALNQRSEPQPGIPVAAMQVHQDAYALKDFSSIGLDRNYEPMVRDALASKAVLVVLPESVALGALTLDGTASRTKPPEWQFPRASWDAAVGRMLAGDAAAVVIGLDTVEAGQDHNTLVAWTSSGMAGWYHKRRLVPFSEYRPPGWGGWLLSGQSQYVRGHGVQLIRVNGLMLGGFICQEVLLPRLIRASVLEGADVLVSGGNDGVFSDPAVAQVHADAAQLRAIEAGRYLVRAMKTGITAVIDPWGREVTRSRSSEPVLLSARIEPRTQVTPYARWGDWVVAVAAGALMALGAAVWKERQAP